MLFAQFPQSQCDVICEKPFSAAVRRTFEIGAAYEGRYLIALDADILLFPDAVEYMLYEVERYDKGAWFRIDFPIYDKFRGRTTGVHFYNNRYSRDFLLYLQNSGKEGVVRPEYDNLKAFCARTGLGYSYIPHYIVGKHDYFQYYRDIYRKYYMREPRCRVDGSSEHMLLTLQQLKRSYIDDFDYVVALQGFEDSRDDLPETGDICSQEGIREKGSITHEDQDIIHRSLSSNCILKKALKGNAYEPV
jgi:hypothetical protein